MEGIEERMDKLRFSVFQYRGIHTWILTFLAIL